MINWWQEAAKEISNEHRDLALQRQAQLTKPAGSLGRLEDLAVDFSGFQGRSVPVLEKICMRVFAGDHGVVEEGVSAFPQAVTAEMIRNFSRGGAAISVLAKQQGADFLVVNMGTVTLLEELPQLQNIQLMAGTHNFCLEAALTETSLQQAMNTGRDQLISTSELFVGGEMGIGNTTAAAAIASALLQLEPQQTVGPGTGLNETGIIHKAQVIDRALALHQLNKASPEEVLRCVGGLEIAALCGAYIGAAQLGIPSLVDGYICTAAALLACRMNASVRPWLLFSHRSAEPGHAAILKALQAQPLLDLGMRLGEGSGAMLALPLLKSALQLHAQMATFGEAGVSDKD